MKAYGSVKEKERAGVKLSSWPEIGSDGDVLLTPYVPKGITGYDDDDDDDVDEICTINSQNSLLQQVVDVVVVGGVLKTQ